MDVLENLKLRRNNMFKRILNTVMAIVLVTTLGLTGCSNSKPSESKSDNPNKPVVISLEGGDWGYPTPFSHYSRGPGVFKMTLIFDSLLERGEKGYIPWIADKWDISKDGLIYTFTLKENVKWQDGKPMTAEDIKFSFEYFAKHPPVSNEGPKQKVATLQFVPVSDSALALDKGEIDLTGSITTDILSKYQTDKEYKVMQNPAFWGYRLIFNMDKRTELKDKEIRQAFAYAIDKNELVEKVARKAAVPGNAGYLPVGHIWYNSNAKNYEFNIEKAKQLLKGNKLSFKLLTGNSNDELRIAELLKISLAKAGIDISITSADTKTRDAAIKKGNYEIVLNGHGGWGGDADLLRTAFAKEKTSNQSPSADGIPGYSNDQLNELCKQQLYEMDVAKRKAIVFKIQELIAEEIPLIPLYNTTGYVVFKPAKFDGWKYMFDHHEVTHNKLSYLDVKQ